MPFARSLGSARSFLFLVTLSTLSVLASITANAADTLVATLPGEFSVDNKGSANYSVPLTIPPGRQGMQPQLSLNYSSSGGNGPLGLGFSLSTGFPQAIARGRSILARDGVTRGVSFDDSNPDLSLRDKFYLDGKRLICVAGSYGQAGSVYRTEVDSFVTITTNPTGSTIETFVAIDKSGTKMTFGKLASATDGYQVGTLVGGVDDTMANEWALKRVEDAVGNRVDLKYKVAGEGEYLLDTIEYTGSTDTTVSPAARVRFLYNQYVVAGNVSGDTSRLDHTFRYVGQRSFAQRGRLDQVVSEFITGPSTGTVFSQYDLSYEYSKDTELRNVGPTRLLSLAGAFRDPVTAGLQSVNPTQFTWEANTTSFTTVANPLVPSADNYVDSFAFADVNGDGRDDFIDFETAGAIKVALANGSGFNARTNWLASAALWKGPESMVRMCDINGDGLKDIVCTSLGDPNLYALVSTGSSFVQLGGGTQRSAFYTLGTEFRDPPASGGGSNFLDIEREAFVSRISIADYTGDGRDDILIHRYDGQLQVLRSEGTSFTKLALANVGANPLAGAPNWGLWSVTFLGFHVMNNFGVAPMPCDLNGDGLTDYVWVETTQKCWDWQNSLGSGTEVNGDKAAYAVTSLASGGFSQKTELTDPIHWGWSDVFPGAHRSNAFVLMPGDVNGDGLTDFSLIKRAEQADASVYNNGLFGGTPQCLLRMETYVSTGSSGVPSFAKLDLFAGQTNSFARVDINGTRVNPWFDKIEIGNWINDYYARPSVTTTVIRPLLLASSLSSSGDNMTMTDVNGDGKVDYVWYSTATSPAGWWVMYSQGTRFSSPMPAPLGWTSTAVIAGGGSQERFSTRASLDLNGDGISDYAYFNGSYDGKPGVQGFHISQGQQGNRLALITDGLKRTTSVAYKPITDDSVYTPGVVDDPSTTTVVEGVTYPIRELRSATYVVSDVWKDSGVYRDPTKPLDPRKDCVQFSYQYSGNRLDLSGRGGLGFHSFVTLDRETGLFKYQFLAQSFPMTGLTAREQTYRYWESTDHTKVNFRFITSHDNTVVFDEVDNGATDLTKRYATVYPFISQAVESRWENDDLVPHFGPWVKAGSPESKAELLFSAARPTDLPHITITAKSWFDNQSLTGDPQTTIPGGYYASDTNGTANVVRGTPKWNDFDSPFTPANNPSLRKITYGNLRKLWTSYGDGFSETVVTDYKTAASVTVNGVAVTTLSGLPETVTPTVTATDYTSDADTKAPIKRYTYWKTTPLVSSETIDADLDGAATGKLDLKTTYVRDDTDTRGRVKETQITGYVDSTTATSTSLTVSSVTKFNDRFDLPEEVKNAYGHLTTTAYFDLLGLPKWVTDVNSAKVETDYDALGRVAQTRDLNLLLKSDSTFAWTAATASDWKKTQSVAVPSTVTDGVALSSVYAVHTTATSSAVTGTSMQPPVTGYFDRLGRTIRTVREGFADQKTTTDTIYNKLGQIVATSLPYAVGATPLWTRTAYDKLGRVETVTGPNGTTTTNKYIGRVTQVTVNAPALSGIDPPAQVNTTLVDAKGRTIKVWNADNVPTSLDPTTGSTKVASIEYKLDGFGRMRSTVLLGNTPGTSNTVTASYDALGRQTELNDPDKGRWTYINNVLGQVLTQEDARHSVTTSTFDPLGRPLTRTTTEPSSGPVETASWYYYDTAANATRHTVTQGEQGWIGALQREEAATPAAPGYAFSDSAAGKTATFHYFDAKGRPSITLTTIDKKWFYTCTDYDAVGRVGAVRNFWKPSGFEAPTDKPYMWQDFGYSYKYDSESYLLELRDSSGQVWWEADASKGYDHLDRPCLVRKGHGHWTKRTYRPEDGVLTSIKTGPDSGSATVQNLRFDFDGLGNLTSRADDLPRTSGSSPSETFGYDNLNRLTHRNGAEIVTYAINGNVSNKLDVNGNSSDNYVYGGATDHPHAVTSAFGYSMTYDLNGNLLTRTKGTETWSTKWAGFDKPRWLAKTAGTVTVGSEFLYNANRSRVIQMEFDSMSSGATAAPNHYNRKRIYAWGASGEIDYKNLNPAAGTATWQLDTIRLYVPGPDGVIGAMEFAPNSPPEQVAKTKRSLVYHYDHLGSVDTVTLLGDRTTHVALDDTGKQARHSFDPWGQRRDPNDWDKQPVNTTIGGHADVTPRGFTGHEMMDDLGLVHMNGRIYDPLLNRFLSADLIVQFPGSLQSFNRYSYVMNNPLSLTDPSGFSAVSEFTSGVVVGFAEGVDPTMGRVSNIVEQHVQNSGVPGAPASLSSAETAGRIAGNLAAMVTGYLEIGHGSSLMAGGAAATGIGTAGGVTTSPTGGGAVIGGTVAVAGAVVGTVGTIEAAHGILSVAQGGAHAVQNGTRLLNRLDVASSRSNSASGGRIQPEKPSGKGNERPQLTHNPKHHSNAKSPEPKNVDDLYKRSTADKSGVRWTIDKDGTIHRFAAERNGKTHWNGSTAGKDPIENRVIPNDVQKRLQEELKKLKELEGKK